MAGVGRALATSGGGSHANARGGIVRCDECKVEPVTPNHFCQCCGRSCRFRRERLSTRRKRPRLPGASRRPCCPRPRRGSFVGIHFTPEPYVDEPVAESESVVDQVDVDTHFGGFDAALPEPTVPVAAPAQSIDSEAHFAGHAPVAATPAPQVWPPPSRRWSSLRFCRRPPRTSTAMCPRLAARAAVDLPKSAICARGASRRFSRCSMRRQRPIRCVAVPRCAHGCRWCAFRSGRSRRW